MGNCKAYLLNIVRIKAKNIDHTPAKRSGVFLCNGKCETCIYSMIAIDFDTWPFSRMGELPILD